jgi:hypothetical protein
MHSWDQMKPRTVYDKAVQDFTETARRLASLDQHFRQASFAEFKMLMFDDELLKRYRPRASARCLHHSEQKTVHGPVTGRADQQDSCSGR